MTRECKSFECIMICKQSYPELAHNNHEMLPSQLVNDMCQQYLQFDNQFDPCHLITSIEELVIIDLEIDHLIHSSGM